MGAVKRTVNRQLFKSPLSVTFGMLWLGYRPRTGGVKTVQHRWCWYSGAMRTKRGIAIIHHLLPEPSPVERELALDALAGVVAERSAWPTRVLDPDGHYLVVSPALAAALAAQGGTSDLINWQPAATGVGAAYWAASQVAASLK